MRKVFTFLISPIGPLIMWPISAIIVYMLFHCSAEVCVILGLAIIGAVSVCESIDFIGSQAIQYFKFRRNLKKQVQMIIHERQERK